MLIVLPSDLPEAAWLALTVGGLLLGAAALLFVARVVFAASDRPADRLREIIGAARSPRDQQRHVTRQATRQHRAHRADHVHHWLLDPRQPRP